MANEPTFREQVTKALENNDHSLAFDLAKELTRLINETDPSNTQQMNALTSVRARLMVVAMRYYKRDTLVDLFEQSPIAMLNAPEQVDVIENLSYRLLEEDFFDERDEFRQALRTALERSDDRLGAEDITLGQNQVESSVSNWIKLIISELGSGDISNVQLARFLAQNKDANQLGQSDKLILRKLIKLYEYLKKKSEDLEAYEGHRTIETLDGEIIMVGDGEVDLLYDEDMLKSLEQQAKNGELSVSELVDLKVRYPERFGEYKVDIGPLTELPAMDPEEAQRISNEFFSKQAEKYGRSPAPSGRITSRETDSLVQILPNAAKSDLDRIKQDLMKIVRLRQDFAEFMKSPQIREIIKNEFPEQMGEKNKTLIEQNIFTPLAFQALLQILFIDKTGLSPEEALWHSFEIVKRFPMELSDFKTLVSFDVSKRRLVWKY